MAAIRQPLLSERHARGNTSVSPRNHGVPYTLGVGGSIAERLTHHVREDEISEMSLQRMQTTPAGRRQMAYRAGNWLYESPKANPLTQVLACSHGCFGVTLAWPEPRTLYVRVVQPCGMDTPHAFTPSSS